MACHKLFGINLKETKKEREFTYLGDIVSVGGRCEAAITGRTRYWWVMFRECVLLLHENRFSLMLKGVLCKNNVGPAILYDV